MSFHNHDTEDPSISKRFGNKRTIDVTDNVKWFRPDQRPYNNDKGAPEISTTVLLYDPIDKIHSFGWFNFQTDKWRSIEEFYFNNGWKWCYLPVPE